MRRYDYLCEYLTEHGDTIQRIALKFYLRAHLWQSVYDINRSLIGDDPYAVPSGRAIKIPLLNIDEIVHTVSRNDTWQNIAEEYYGSSSLFPYIAIKNNHTFLVEGDAVIIPALLTRQDYVKAKELRDALSNM
jgi:nucleoid-associated protein YgaU